MVYNTTNDMELTGCISMTTRDYPKIKPTDAGAEVSFDLYGVSIDELLKLTGKELKVSLDEV